MAQATARQGQQGQGRQGSGQEMQQLEEQAKDMVQHLTEYARENPTNAALWCFGIGFVLGWKLKPW